MSNEIVTMMVRQPMLEMEMPAAEAAEHRARARKLMIQYLGVRLSLDVQEHLGIEISEERNGLTFTFSKADIEPLWVYQGDGEWPAHDDLRDKDSWGPKFKNGSFFSALLAAAHNVASQVMWHIAMQTACRPVLEERQRQMSEAINSAPTPCSLHERTASASESRREDEAERQLNGAPEGR